MARKTISGRARLRWLGALVLLGLIAGGFGWWHMRHWHPSREAYPVQGVEVGSDDGPVDFTALKTIGADFAYLDASASAFARDLNFARNLDQARAAKLQVGAVHRYDPCQPAGPQAANFVTIVPRDAKMLPPAVELDQTADECPVRVSDQAVESELMTFINQIETHTGKPSLLKVSPAFEKRYRIAQSIDRNLWLSRNRFQPDYAGRPWTLWTANTALDNEANEEPVRWVVVQH
jgi:lysozyme